MRHFGVDTLHPHTKNGALRGRIGKSRRFDNIFFSVISAKNAFCDQKHLNVNALRAEWLDLDLQIKGILIRAIELQSSYY